MPPIATFVALADPTRCRIIEILRTGPRPVHQIALEFDISRPAISRHLGVLKQARLISETKSGRENLYALQPRRLKSAQDWLAGLAPASPVTKRLVASTKPDPRPKAEMEPSAAPVRARRQQPLSQMGFDF